MRSAPRSLGQLVEVCCTAKSTSGGSAEMPTWKEEATSTRGAPSTSAAIAATPDGNSANVRRSAPSSLPRAVSGDTVPPPET